MNNALSVVKKSNTSYLLFSFTEDIHMQFLEKCLFRAYAHFQMVYLFAVEFYELLVYFRD